MTGDITPAYSVLSTHRMKTIVKCFPDIKVVFIAREPVERFWSQYCMRLGRGTAEHYPTPESIVTTARSGRYAGRSHPTTIVRRWRHVVPRGQFGLFYFDDLRKDAAALSARIVSFLGADPSLSNGAIAPDFNRKQSRLKVPMPDQIREALVEHFSDELRACAGELGGPAVDWPKRYGV
jgi:hypothetical protein